MDALGVADKRMRVCLAEHHGIKSCSIVSSPRNCMEKKMTMLDLGEDLLAEILRHLPLKSFTRCLCVCKKWRSEISCNPLLRRNHLLLTIVPRNSISIERHDPRNLWRNDFKYLSLEKHERNNRILGLECPLGFMRDDPRDFISLYASSNGLLFFVCFHGPQRRCKRGWYIFNPWTREYARLPNPFGIALPMHCGLAFDSEHWQVNSNNNSNEASYKVVILNKLEVELIAYIYFSETQCWRVLRKIMPWRLQHIALGNVVYCNRILHWVCGVTCALLFNVEKETFDLLDLPLISSSRRSNVRVPANPCHSWFEENCPLGRLTECRGQLHYLLIGFNLQLHMWKMSTTSSGCYDGWVMLNIVDLKLPVTTNLLLFPAAKDFPYFEPIDMDCVADDKILLNIRRTKTVWYDLKTGRIQPFREKVCDMDRDYFRYSPTTKFLGGGRRAFPPFIFEPDYCGDFSPFHFRQSLYNDLGALSSRSQIDLSLSASLVEIYGSSPAALLSSIELFRLCTPSLGEVSLATASFSHVVSPDFEVLSSLPISSSSSALAATLPLSSISLALLLSISRRLCRWSSHMAVRYITSGSHFCSSSRPHCCVPPFMLLRSPPFFPSEKKKKKKQRKRQTYPVISSLAISKR